MKIDFGFVLFIAIVIVFGLYCLFASSDQDDDEDDYYDYL